MTLDELNDAYEIAISLNNDPDNPQPHALYATGFVGEIKKHWPAIYAQLKRQQRQAEIQAKVSGFVTVPCHTCDGIGIVPLSGTLFRTLRAIQPFRDGVQSNDLLSILIIKEPKLKQTALCNRLRKLADLGLITRTAVTAPSGGTEYIYQAKVKETEHDKQNGQ